MNHHSASAPQSAAESATPAPPTTRYAYFVLGLLTAINLVNYIDRQIVAAVKTDVVASLGLNDEQWGYVLSVLIISYTVLSPLFGRLGDQSERRRLIAIGIALWSVATALAGLAQNYHQLLLARSLIGVGEASYATIAPSLISDVFPKARRGTALGIFFAAIPLGYALGYLLGGLSPTFGWRNTMFIVGGPGLLLAAVVYFFMHEPKRGGLDEGDEAEQVDENELLASAPTWLVSWNHKFTQWLESLPAAKRATGIGHHLIDQINTYAKALVIYAGLFTIGPFLLATLGYTALTFSLGALGDWAPAFLETDKYMSPESARTALGLIVLISGFVGTFSGGAISDWLLRYTRRSYFLVCGVTVSLGIVPTLMAIGSPTRAVYLGGVFIAVLLLFMSNAPVNAIIVNSVGPKLRASAVALNILCIHVGGDAISRVAVGTISEAIKTQAAHGTVSSAVSSLAQMFSVDPATQHLSLALLITPVAMLLAGIFFLSGMRTIK